MKARVLKKILNDTNYIVSNNDEYIAVGSPLCHDLIKVNKKTKEMTFALDTWKKGKSSLGNSELLFIAEKLEELIANNEIQKIIDEDDIIEKPLTVYSFSDFEIVESITDEYGWPNTTISGQVMYNNVWFKTKEEAQKKAISETDAWIKYLNEEIEKAEKIIIDSTKKKEKFQNFKDSLEQ